MPSLREERQRRINRLLMEKFNLISEETTTGSEKQIRDLIAQDTAASIKQASSLMRGNDDLIKKFGTSDNKKEVGAAAMAYAPNIKHTHEYGGQTKFLTQVSAGMKYENWLDRSKRSEWENNIDAENVKKAEEYATLIMQQKYGLAPDGGIATSPEIEKWITKNFGWKVYSKDEETGEMVGSDFIPDIPVNLMAWKQIGANVTKYLPGIPGVGDIFDWGWGKPDKDWGRREGYGDAVAEEAKLQKAAIAEHYKLMTGQALRILQLPEPEKYGFGSGETLNYQNPYNEEGNYWLVDPGMISLGPRGFDYASRKDWEFRRAGLETVRIDKDDDKEELLKRLEVKDEEVLPRVPWTLEMMPAEYFHAADDFVSKTKPGSAKWINPLGSKYKHTSGFGMRILKPGAEGRPHAGIDMGAQEGTPILAMTDGTITYRAAGFNNGAGNYVHITTSSGEWKFRMLHMSKFGKFGVGDRVKQGDIIGYVGNTGTSTGAHLHLDVVELGTGNHVDPIEAFSKEAGIEIGARGGERGRQRYIDKHGHEHAKKEMERRVGKLKGRGYDPGFGPEYFETKGIA